ncbi:MAG TPA: lipoprotein [Stellaceae bacterium]|nr:lipoprotein [Stellaceae bacterium]
MRGKIAWALVVLVVAVALAGCGRKGPPQPPPGVPNTYPRTYPGA